MSQQSETYGRLGRFSILRDVEYCSQFVWWSQHRRERSLEQIGISGLRLDAPSSLTAAYSRIFDFLGKEGYHRMLVLDIDTHTDSCKDA